MSIRHFDTCNKQTGRDLGLATVHSVMARHNGHIKVSSKEDIGTTFSLYLPATDQPAHKALPSPENKESPAPQKKLKTLVMDDEEVTRKLSSEMLSIMVRIT